MQRICVFCGSSAGNKPSYATAAADLGRALAARGVGLVNGGGHVGLMGATADAVLAAGGEAIGVIPEALRDRELAHTAMTQLHVTVDMHARKALMASLADAFIALPGGLGTFEELFEVATWAQLNIHRKPIGILDVDDYYHHLAQWLRHAETEGFVKPEHSNLFHWDTDPARLIERLLTSAEKHPG